MSLAALALATGAFAVALTAAVTSSLERLYRAQLGALIAMIVVVASIAVIIIVDVRRALLRPLRELNTAVAAVASGSYATHIPMVGYAELTDLSRDIELMRTTLVAAIDERERAHENLRSMFDFAPDAMVAVAEDGTITMANGQALQLYGYSADELIGRQVKTLLPAEWRRGLAAESARYLADRQSQPASREIKSAGLRCDGSTFPTEVRLSLLSTGQETLVVAAVRDVSERLAMEAERERLRAAAEQERLQQRQRQSRRLESLGQLVGGVAHDFNNLLNVIAGYADFTAEQLGSLAREDERIEPVLADVEQVRAAAQQAIRVTRQLLTFARSEAANREVLDLNEVVESAGQLLRRSLGEQVDLVIPAQREAEPEPVLESLRGRGEAILLVEDEESLRTMASRILTRNGYQVCAAADGAGAPRPPADPAHPIDLLVTDMVMPAMLGIEVAARVHALRPRLPALFISEYAQQVLDFHGIPAVDYDILRKPFTEAALLSRVRRALDRGALAQAATDRG